MFTVWPPKACVFLVGVGCHRSGCWLSSPSLTRPQTAVSSTGWGMQWENQVILFDTRKVGKYSQQDLMGINIRIGLQRGGYSSWGRFLCAPCGWQKQEKLSPNTKCPRGECWLSTGHVNFYKKKEKGLDRHMLNVLKQLCGWRNCQYLPNQLCAKPI